MRHPHGASLIRLLLVLLFGVFLASPAPKAVASPEDDATAIIKQLNPIDLALGPLIDRAISEGNQALASRLAQLQGIIQEALATADAILQHRIADLDSRATNRLVQLKATIDEEVPQIDAIVHGNLEDADQRLAQRIDQLQIRFGSLVEAINWLHVDPVVNLGADGLSIYKQTGDWTVFFISGVGMKKADLPPVAAVHDGGQPLAVNIETSSPTGFQARIRNVSLQESGNKQYRLDLCLSRGYRLHFLRAKCLDASYPLNVCVLPAYSIEATATASGEKWERITKSIAPQHINCCKGCDPENFDVEAGKYAFGEYEVDPTVGDHGGLDADDCLGEGDHSCTWIGNKLHLWCSSKNRDRGGWVEAKNPRVHLRRRVKEDTCGTATLPPTPITFTDDPVPLKLNVKEAIGPCGDSGLSASPLLKTGVIVHRAGMPDVKKQLTTNVPTTLDDRTLRLQIDSDGNLEARLQPVCRWRYSPALAWVPSQQAR